MYNYAYLIAVLMKTDIVAMPSPLPDTKKISTNSLFLLKYWPTIRVAGSRVMATPTPNFPRWRKELCSKSDHAHTVSFSPFFSTYDSSDFSKWTVFGKRTQCQLVCTYHGSIAEEKLVKLTSKWGEQAAQCSNQSTYHSRETGWFATTNPNDDGRYQQANRHWHGSQPTWNWKEFLNEWDYK